MKNKFFILNPDYILRNDKERALLYSLTDYSLNVCKIHPIQAMILSFFSQKRSFNDNISLLQNFLELDEADIIKVITPFLENEEEVYNSWGGNIIKFPKKVLVEVRDEQEIIREVYEPEFFKYQHLNLKEKRYFKSPIDLTFMLTNKCQTNCVYCYADRRDMYAKSLETDRIISLIKEARILNVRKINIIGGEVFFHKDWDIILKALVSHKYSPEVISTKIPINETIIEKLLATGYKNPIQISLDSIDETILSETLDVKSSYRDRIMESIKLIDKKGIRYQIATILTNKTDDINAVYKLYEFIKELKNIEVWRISPAWNSLYADESKFNNIKSQKKDIHALFSKIEYEIKPSAKFGIILDYSFVDKAYKAADKGYSSFDGGVCYALHSQIFVLPNGLVTICEQLYWKHRFIIGDLSISSIEELWKSDKAQTLYKLSRKSINKKSACSKCKLFKDCYSHRCWVDVIKAYGDDNWDYPDPRCSKAPKMMNIIEFK